MDAPPSLSVSELTQRIKGLLEGSFPSVDVDAEISGWKVYPSGRAYFTLKDEGAQIGAVMFAGALSAASQRLRDARTSGVLSGSA